MDSDLKENLEQKYGSINEVEPEETGMAHEIYFLKLNSGREMVLKIGSEELNHRFEREPYVLKYLNEKGLPVPEVIEFSLRNNEYRPYLLMNLAEGQNINSHSEGRKFKFLNEETKKSVLRDAAENLALVYEDTSFGKFGSFRSEMNLEYESKEWSQTLLQILKKNELKGIENGAFSHRHQQALNFLEENLQKLNTSLGPVIVHQDCSFNNMIVKGDRIEAIIDWERAIAGHLELDLFKFERSISSKFRTQNLGEEYGKMLVEYYNSINPLQEGWEERRKIYHFIYLIQTMWTYDSWSRDIPEQVREDIKPNMESEFQMRIENQETKIFHHMD